MKVTKAYLGNRVYKNSKDLTRKQSDAAVDFIVETIKARLEKGEDVLISGFGKFNIRDKSARRGRNPITGKPLMLEARRVVTFKPSGSLRKKVNGKKS